MPPLGFGCSGQAAGRGSRQGRACRTWHHTQAWTSQLSLPDARRCRNNGHRLRGPSHSQMGHRKTAHELQLECRTERALAGQVFRRGLGCLVLSCAVLYGTIRTVPHVVGVCRIEISSTRSGCRRMQAADGRIEITRLA